MTLTTTLRKVKLTAVWLRCANSDKVSTLCNFIERKGSIAQHWSNLGSPLNRSRPKMWGWHRARWAVPHEHFGRCCQGRVGSQPCRVRDATAMSPSWWLEC